MTIDYAVTEHNEQTGRLLLAAADHYLVVDLTSGAPIRMTRADTEAQARTVYQEA